MQLEEFFDYKNRLIQDILTNEKIVKLIDGEIPFENAESFVYSQVFPYEFLPETTQEGKTYICCDVDVYPAEATFILTPIIYVWVFTHKSLLRLPQGGVRTDALCNEICKTINGSRYYGLGELRLYSCKRFAPQTDYNGKVMVFHAKDISYAYDPKKKTPSNRKLGI